MSTVYPMESAMSNTKPQAPEGFRLVSAHESAGIRIEEHRDPGAGSAFLAYRLDTGESVLHEQFYDRTGTEPGPHDAVVDRCYSLWTVIESLAREFGRPLVRTFPETAPEDPMFDANLSARLEKQNRAVPKTAAHATCVPQREINVA
ncbi:MAG: hypothetical protein WBG50_02240 [Desulfomonilaceae bacterium]